jgi:hypothetical protein
MVESSPMIDYVTVTTATGENTVMKIVYMKFPSDLRWLINAATKYRGLKRRVARNWGNPEVRVSGNS